MGTSCSGLPTRSNARCEENSPGFLSANSAASAVVIRYEPNAVRSTGRLAEEAVGGGPVLGHRQPVQHDGFRRCGHLGSPPRSGPARDPANPAWAGWAGGRAGLAGLAGGWAGPGWAGWVGWAGLGGLAGWAGLGWRGGLAGGLGGLAGWRAGWAGLAGWAGCGGLGWRAGLAGWAGWLGWLAGWLGGLGGAGRAGWLAGGTGTGEGSAGWLRCLSVRQFPAAPAWRAPGADTSGGDGTRDAAAGHDGQVPGLRAPGDAGQRPSGWPSTSMTPAWSWPSPTRTCCCTRPGTSPVRSSSTGTPS